MAKSLRTFTIDPDISTRLDDYAKLHEVARSNLVEELLREFLDKAVLVEKGTARAPRITTGRSGKARVA